MLLLEPELGAGFFSARAELPPMDEKFHLPLGSFSIITWGFSMVTSVTLTCWEKISGISSTPTFTFFAVRNGPELNFGSSLIDKLSIPSEPPRIDKLRSPSCTFRPRASEALASIVGRNLFTGIKKGTTNKITINPRMAMPIHFIFRFMDSSGRAGLGGGPTCVQGDNITPCGTGGVALLFSRSAVSLLS